MGIHPSVGKGYCLKLAVFRCLLKSNTDKATARKTTTATIIIKTSNGKVTELAGLPFVSGAIGVTVGVIVGVVVVGVGVAVDAGFGKVDVEMEIAPSGMLRVCILLQLLITPLKK